ncbi:hypothetical protein [uncultured Roseobacter sp.]|uniref:hypothetical protein n=1 Tax=uncultured Roseobacter sp. TaxID=114847 RepID=UPI00262CA83B|nr:hypothetical protein [uncultured Roseobacter sp.]
MTHPIVDHWVLLPGTLCTPDVFAPVLDYLGVSVANRIVIELNSTHLQDYEGPLRTAVTDGAIVCGFSLGAMVAAHNLHAMARAKAIVLLACNLFPDPAGNRANREAARDHILAGGARDWVIENWHLMLSDTNSERLDRVASMAESTSHLIAAQTELAASRAGAAEHLTAPRVLSSRFLRGSVISRCWKRPIKWLLQSRTA